MILIVYLIGSIPSGYILVKLIKRKDIRKFGSGNIGMTNVWRVAGPFLGISTLLLDISKGVISIYLPSILFNVNSAELKVLCGIFVLLGNVFSIFLNFKGGKGVGVSIGVFFTILPLECLIGLAVFLILLLIFRIVSIGSLGAFTIVTIITFLFQQSHIIDYFITISCILIWWTHRENIKRIIAGTENKILKRDL
jgi:glycerol-3-phosphate acyltransferase PlsY